MTGKPVFGVPIKGTIDLGNGGQIETDLKFWSYFLSLSKIMCYVPGVTRGLRKPTSWLASNKLCLKFNKSI